MKKSYMREKLLRFEGLLHTKGFRNTCLLSHISAGPTTLPSSPLLQAFQTTPAAA